MRRSLWIRVLAVVLVIAMVSAPVSAATNGKNVNQTHSLIGGIFELIRDIIRDIFDDWFGPGDEEPVPTTPVEPGKPVTPTTPTEPGETEPDETEPEETEPVATEPGETTEPGDEEDTTEPDEETSDYELNLIEGHKNAENGQLLRGVTYSLNTLFPTQSVATHNLTFGGGLALGNASRGGMMGLNGMKAVGSKVSPQADTAPVEIVMTVGGRHTFTVDGDVSGSYDNDKVNVSTNVETVETSTANLATLDIGLESGSSYLIVNANHLRKANLGNTPYALLNTVASGNNNLRFSSGLTLNNDRTAVTAFEDSMVWNLAISDTDSNGYMTATLTNGDGMYLANSGAVKVVDTPTNVTIEVGGDAAPNNTVQKDAWRINFGSTYLNWTNNGAATWTSKTDDGNHWCFYKITRETTSTTTVTFTATAVGETTVEIGGVTYHITVNGETELVYFPVTMFNYDETTINSFTDAMDANGTTVREGFYFSDGNPGNYTFNTAADLSAYVDGNYYIQNFRAKDNNVASWLYYNPDGANNRRIHSTTQASAQIWTLTNKGNNQVTLSYVDNGTTYYMTIGDGTSGVTTTETLLTLVPYSLSEDGVQIKGTEYLCQFGGSRVTVYGGYEQSDDPGNGMAFFPVADDGTVADESLRITMDSKVMASGYREWNYWSYKPANNNLDNAQNKFYTGLVEEKLDDDNNIVFTVNEPGIFTFDSGDPTIINDGKKDIYQNVGLPFVKNEKGYYTFDSDAHGTYFADTDGNGASDPGYGASDNYFNMFFDYQNTQGWDGMYYGDGSTNLWAPFNTNANDTGEGAIDYHLGMRADIPFSMTPNGCIKSTDDNSEHITFTFAGDDDVWIFIDGHLVIDLGGIHNRIGATIDFAANTITYFRPDSNTQTLPIGSFNDPENYPLNEDGTITVKLYNDTNGEGALGQTRTAFASDEEHEMSIFYLERGKGTSNCKIEFNLPMRDTVLITKDATKSWSEEQDEADGENGDGTVSLTAKEQAAVDKLNFGFTLYKKTADETEYTAVANTNYFIQNQSGEVIGYGSTDSNGKFYLKNGQTAKFMTDIPKEGITYYVVEDAVPQGFLTPDYKYAGVATWGYDYIGEAILIDENGDYILDAEGNLTSGIVSGTVANAADMGEHELPMDAAENKSYEVTVKGSVESIDSIEFICTNYLDAELPNPSALANEDIIVIDYGLPVQIDPLANDLFRGDDIEIVAWGDKTLTLNEALDDYGNAIEAETTWSEEVHEFDFGNVTFNDVDFSETEGPNGSTYIRDSFTYELTKQLTEVEVIHYIIKVNSTIDNVVNGEVVGQKSASRYCLAKVYIVPATIMYYEENFSDLVTFTGSGWSDSSTVANQANVSPFQEPGVVGTFDDSTYGSDVAYLNDNGDSNGTYRFGDTTNGAIRFTYTFTGTGTSIFARASALTGYMQVKIYEGTDTTGDYLDIYYRDTYYEDSNGTDLDSDGTLYNIPVYTNDGLEYGTYTVVCTVAKKGTLNAGPVVEEDGVLVKRSGGEFYLDGIRIMQPLNEYADEELVELALGAYATDGEANLDVVTLRNKLIADVADGAVQWDGENFVVLTDTLGNITTADEYVSFGPKEEVYLAPGQKVTFSLKYWEPEGLKLYMGMKAPFGSAKVNIGHNTYDLNNAPDCYYDVTEDYASLITETDADGYEYYVVTYTFEAAESIAALTNIKVVGNYEFTIIENNDIDFPGDNGEGEDTDLEIPDSEGDGEDNTNP